jgi:hypothetical protein
MLSAPDCGIFAPMRRSSSSTFRIMSSIRPHWSGSSSTVAPFSFRFARRPSASISSRSRSSCLTTGGGGSSASLRARCAFTNSSGCPSSRARTSGLDFRQAAYNSPASRLVIRHLAIPSAMRAQSSACARAIGTRHFIATCAGIAPLRTRSWMPAGSSSTRLIRRDTQLGLRSNRRASSSLP